MAGDSRSTQPHVDRDGVRFHETSGVRKPVWLLVLAMGLVSIALFMVVRPALQRHASEITAAPRTKAVENGAQDARAARLPAKPLRAAAPREEKAGPPPVHAEPARPAVHDAEQAPPAEETHEEPPMFGPAVPGAGVALFPPPGTKPMKRGIVVPDDFQLPPGYVRHYQVTDDGQRVPAILMFHPDYQPLDEQGEPIPLPADRVVPPEMAPAGLTIQILEVPENQAQAEGSESPAAQDSTP